MTDFTNEFNNNHLLDNIHAFVFNFDWVLTNNRVYLANKKHLFIKRLFSDE